MTDDIRAIVIDDTHIGKRGKRIEGVSYVYDHVQKRTVLGYKVLTVSYHDGSSLYPLCFSLHSEGKKGNKLLNESKTTMAYRFIETLLRSRLAFEYILFDSWYFSSAIVNKLEQRRLSGAKKSPHFISKAKSNVEYAIILHIGRIICFHQVKFVCTNSSHETMECISAVFGSIGNYAKISRW